MSNVVRLFPCQSVAPLDGLDSASSPLDEVPAYWLRDPPPLRVVRPDYVADPVCTEHAARLHSLRAALVQAEHEARRLAAAHGICIESAPPGAYVWPAQLGGDGDPYESDHYAETWLLVLGRVRTYVAMI